MIEVLPTSDNVPRKVIMDLASELDAGSYFGIIERKTTNGFFMATIGIRRSSSLAVDYIHKYVPANNKSNSINKNSGVMEYWLTWVGKRAYAVAALVVDDLVRKKDHAQLLIEFRKSVTSYRRIYGRSGKLTDEERAKRRGFARRLKEMNTAAYREEYIRMLPRKTAEDIVYDRPATPVPPITSPIDGSVLPPSIRSSEEEIKSIFD